MFVGKTFQIDEGTGELIAGWLSGSQEPINHCTETENFIEMIHNAKCRGALGKIGLKIKESTLPESEKAVIRKVYQERSNSLA